MSTQSTPCEHSGYSSRSFSVADPPRRPHRRRRRPRLRRRGTPRASLASLSSWSCAEATEIQRRAPSLCLLPSRCASAPAAAQRMQTVQPDILPSGVPPPGVPPPGVLPSRDAPVPGCSRPGVLPSRGCSAGVPPPRGTPGPGVLTYSWGSGAVFLSSGNGRAP